MENYITVTVSPFYTGRGWTDHLTGIDFKVTHKIYPVRISKEKNLSGIQNSVRMNNLLLLSGTFPSPTEELNIEALNPAELTKKQFDEIVKKLQLEDPDGVGQEELDAALLAKKEAEDARDEALSQKGIAEGERDTALSQKETAEGERDTAVSQKEAAELARDTAISEKETAEGQRDTALSQKTVAEGERDAANAEVATLKDEFFKKHVFTEEDLAPAYYTVAILKEILAAKEIDFGASDAKAVLIQKLIAGQTPVE